jgi:hypothetical protein
MNRHGDRDQTGNNRCSNSNRNEVRRSDAIASRRKGKVEAARQQSRHRAALPPYSP